MDILDRLTGGYVIQSSELTIERFLLADEWKRRRSRMKSTLINFLDGTEEISIVETSSSGARTRVISDVDGVEKSFLLTSRGSMLKANRWIHS